MSVAMEKSWTGYGWQGNVVLHVVDDPWPFERGEREAPAVVVALDLVERNDERVRRAGLELLDRVVGVVK